MKKAYGHKSYNSKKANKKTGERRDRNKDKFLERLREAPVIQAAAMYAGIHRCTYYRWYDEDPVFQAEADKAIEEGRSFVSDLCDAVVIKKIKEESLAAVKVWQSAYSPRYMNPQRYQDFQNQQRQGHSLSEERMSEIDRCSNTWNEVDPNEDERDDDYEVKPVTEDNQTKIEDKHLKLKNKVNDEYDPDPLIEDTK